MAKKRGRQKGKTYKAVKYPPVLKTLHSDNNGKRIKVKVREISTGGYHLFLHTVSYSKNKTIQQRIKLGKKYIILGKDSSKAMDKKVYEELKRVRDREEMLRSDDPDSYASEINGSKVMFFDYLETVKEKREIEYQSRHGKQADFKPTNHTNLEFQLKKFLKVFSGAADVRLSAINYRFSDGFKYFLMKNVGVNTAGIYLTTFKSVLNQAVKERLLRSNPAKGLSIKKVQVETVWLTPEEVQKISDTPYSHNDIKQAFLFCCYTGLRVSEVMDLRFKHIDETRKRITGLRLKKNLKLKYVPLAPSALEIIKLQQLLGRDDKVFNVSSAVLMNVHLKKIAKAAGIKKRLTTHIGRHTFAINAMEHGVGIYTLKELLGHSDINTTMMYADIVSSRLKDVVERMWD